MFVCCADGGANCLFDYFSGNEADREGFIPQALVGDFDSVRPEVMKFYQDRGATVHKVEN